MYPDFHHVLHATIWTSLFISFKHIFEQRVGFVMTEDGVFILTDKLF